MKIDSFMVMAAAAVLLFCGCMNNNGPGNGGNIGGQTDEHGCRVAAGYSWDKDVGACIRSWELNVDQKKAAKIAIAPLSYYVTVLGVDVGNCSGCFIVHLQRNDNQEKIDTHLENWAFAPVLPEVIHDNSSMTIDEARKIAETSDCVKDGKLTDKYFYNPNSKTWWIDLDTIKKGCAPACVVSEESKTAETNWRCTGLITPEEKITSFDDCVAAGYPVMESNPRRCAVPGGETFTEILSAEASGVVEANNRFAFDLYSKYRTGDGNVFFSPYSISTALAMTYEGARGQTADEMQSVLHFPKDDNARRQGFLDSYNGINGKGRNYTLSTANALWAQKNYTFLKTYFDVTEKYYGGKVTNLDFVHDIENSRKTINNWVENQTNDKIKDLIPQGVIDPSTRLVLTNAIYFKGKWLMQFDKANTQEEDFRVGPGKTVKVQMMSISGENAKFGYYEDDRLQALEMPYDGGDLSMLVLLPKGVDINSMEDSLDAEKIAALRKNLAVEQVSVSLPRFKFETKYFMEDALSKMGMPTAFSTDADFSGMTGKKDLYISHVIHQAFVEVNEEGTEAAAATAVIMELSAAVPNKTKFFYADHPFVFLILERSSGNILFMGRVSDPTK